MVLQANVGHFITLTPAGMRYRFFREIFATELEYIPNAILSGLPSNRCEPLK